MASSTSPLRLTGLSSGMDTDGIIKTLMQLDQAKINRELRARTTLQWKQEALGSIGTDVSALRKTYMSMLSPQNLLTESAYNTYAVKLSGEDSGSISMSGSIYATAGTIKINQIERLAEGATAKSAAGVSNDASKGLSKDNNATLGELDFAKELFTAGDEISFKINGTSFSFKKTDTLSKMLSTVNGSDAGVTMTYSRLTDGFSIATKELGTGTSLKIENVRGNAFGAVDSAFGIDDTTTYTGTNAKLTINGVDVERESNSFSIDGIDYTLNSVTDKVTTAVVSRDVTAAFDKIKGFVDGYNALVKRLNEMLAEKKTTSEAKYTPLTDEEKSALTEKQIEDWEAIAKKGVLRNDSDIQTMLTKLRTALYDTVSGAGISPASIGIGTANYFSGGSETRGQIALDEDKLRAALERDPEQVMRMFTDQSQSADSAVAYRENGLMYRMSKILDQYVNGSQATAVDRLSNAISTSTDRIDKLETKLSAKAEKLYQKYAAMETMLSQLNSQGDWLSSITAQMSASK